jgi:uncharacterized peroxidase-related enzyme
MAWINTIHETDATGDLAALYKRVGNPDGTVDNVMKVHALNPASLRAHFELYVQAMHKPSPLSRAEREVVATEVSRLNGCEYCLTHHNLGLIRILPPERHAAARALREGDHSGLTGRERALVDCARKLTLTPFDMVESDVEALRSAGLDDRAILDLAQCIGYINYVNRIVTGLGVELGAGEGEAGQWPDT